VSRCTTHSTIAHCTWCPWSAGQAGRPSAAQQALLAWLAWLALDTSCTRRPCRSSLARLPDCALLSRFADRACDAFLPLHSALARLAIIAFLACPTALACVAWRALLACLARRALRTILRSLAWRTACTTRTGSALAAWRWLDGFDVFGALEEPRNFLVQEVHALSNDVVH
jgi:hypothetical protein